MQTAGYEWSVVEEPAEVLMRSGERKGRRLYDGGDGGKGLGKDKNHGGEINIDVFLSDAHGRTTMTHFISDLITVSLTPTLLRNTTTLTFAGCSVKQASISCKL